MLATSAAQSNVFGFGAYVFVSPTLSSTGQREAMLDVLDQHSGSCGGGNPQSDVASATVDPTGCHITAAHAWAWSDPSPGFCEGQSECFIVDFSIMGDTGQGTLQHGYSSTCDPSTTPSPLTATRLPAGTVVGPCQ